MAYSNPNIPTVDIFQQDPVTGLVSQGTVKGVPPSGATYANIFALECQLIDINGSGIYEMTGTVAVPAWTVMGAGALGITQLTGDVTAGPGSGAQVATIAAGVIVNADVNASAAIAFSKLEAMASGTIIVGSAGTVPTEVAVSGDATLAASGALTVTGATGAFQAGGAITNAGGTLAVGFIPTTVNEPQALSGPGAANITTYQTKYTSTGAGDVVTLADATRIGHLKKISYIAEAAGGDTVVVTPTNLAGFTTVTLSAIGDYVLFMWNGADWLVIENVGATLA